MIPIYPDLPDNWAGHPALETPRELGFTLGGNNCIFPKARSIYRTRNLTPMIRGPGAPLPCELYIKTLTGGTVKVIVNGDATVGQLKRLIQKMEGIPPDQQRITLAGRQLDSTQFLRRDYRIQNQATMHLDSHLRVGSGMLSFSSRPLAPSSSSSSFTLSSSSRPLALSSSSRPRFTLRSSPDLRSRAALVPR